MAPLFSAYLQALLSAEKYSKVIALNNRYNLVTLEKDSLTRVFILLYYNGIPK